MAHWNLINFSLADVCREFGYTCEQMNDPEVAPGSIHIKDADGNTLAIGRVWELWHWFGTDVGL